MTAPIAVTARWKNRLMHHRTVLRIVAAVFDFFTRQSFRLRVMNAVFGNSLWYIMLRAHRQRATGDHLGAHRTLMLGQRTASESAQLHLHLSALYRDNGDVDAAYTHLRIAALIKPGYATIRRLSFETEHGLLQQGAATLRTLFEMPDEFLRPWLAMINRVSAFHPEHLSALTDLRQRIRSTLLQTDPADSVAASRAICEALTARWPDAAFQLAAQAHLHRRRLPHDVNAFIRRVENDLCIHPELPRLLWNNENSATLQALFRQSVCNVNDLDSRPGHLVEFFFPPAFFAPPWEEKTTYETVRTAFSNILRSLLHREDTAIVPRLQHNWRYCVPTVTGAKVISYHTVSEPDAHRLHIQESTLSGRCSFDNAGFAGFSSLARNPARIEAFVRDIDETRLIENHQELYRMYAQQNRSKYTQPGDNFPIQPPFVFVALQIQTDIVSTLAHMNGLELLHAVAAFYRQSGIRVVVKKHPFCASMNVQRALQTLSAAGDIIISNNSVHSLIKDAEIVFTVNSGTGLEALIHGRPVVVSGECDYATAAHVVHNATELHQLLHEGIENNLRRTGALLYTYCNDYTCAADDARGIAQRLDRWLETDQ